MNELKKRVGEIEHVELINSPRGYELMGDFHSEFNAKMKVPLSEQRVRAAATKQGFVVRDKISSEYTGRKRRLVVFPFNPDEPVQHFPPDYSSKEKPRLSISFHFLGEELSGHCNVSGQGYIEEKWRKKVVDFFKSLSPRGHLKLVP